MSSSTPDPFPTNITGADDSLLASPSKTRAAAKTAKNWSTVAAWLAELFAPSPVPSFERNDATLAYLLSLVHASDAADSERDLLHRARLEALAEVEAGHLQTEQNHDPSRELLLEIASSLTPNGNSALDDLSSSAIALGAIPPYTSPSLASSLSTLTLSTLTASQHAQRLASITAELNSAITQTQSAISALTASTSDEASTAALRGESAQWTRETKHLALKAAEYQDRLSTLERWRAGLRGPSFTDVHALEAEVAERGAGVRALEARVRAYHGLPADVEVSRDEVRRAQGELAGLRERRGELFGRMAER